MVELKIPDPEYWTTLALSDEDVAEALYNTEGLSYIEPVQYLQMKRHVMQELIKLVFENVDIKRFEEYFLY